MNNYNAKKQLGFTLIELIIVIVIMSILTLIALPSYQTWVLKSHRSDAMSSLAQDQTSIERCYAQTFSYSASCTAFPVFPHSSPQGYYTISLTNQTATSYTLTATSKGTQTRDTTCTTMSLNQTGAKTATSTKCWQP